MAKRILIGISGSIAAYKIADVVSELIKQGHAVRCILTDSAAQFVSPLVLETLSHNPVHQALFGPDVTGTEHIELARWADLFVVAPTTANVLAKLALGLADDLLTTVALATEAPVLIAPAMNTVMFEQPIVQQHLATLLTRGRRLSIRPRALWPAARSGWVSSPRRRRSSRRSTRNWRRRFRRRIWPASAC